jgi:hypothetical protein
MRLFDFELQEREVLRIGWNLAPGQASFETLQPGA